MQCGAGAPGSLGTPGWRSAATILGVAGVLLLGAAAAAFAALSSSPPKRAVLVATVAQPSTPAPVTPPPTTIPVTPAVKTTVPPAAATPPKIPLTTTTPKAANTTTTPTTTTGTGTSTTLSSAGTGGSNGEESNPSAIVLDTNAASAYNPYNYPASAFGDPSLAIDGDSSTAWTAQVDPSTAPKMAVGLLIDLKGAQKVSAVEVVTSTPGMTVQVFAADGTTQPSSITDPAWKQLSRSEVVKKKHTHITLRESNHAFTFLTLWISKAPAASIGTPQAPGHVDVNELELFPG